MDSTMKSHVYTLEEAAMILQVKPVTIRRLVIRKKLPRVPFIRHIRIPCSAVDRLAGGTPS
jgi:excisionase family DNA binding protein